MYILRYKGGAKANILGGVGRGVRAAEKTMAATDKWFQTLEQRINYITNYITKNNISRKFKDAEIGKIVQDSKGMSQKQFQNLVETRIKNLQAKPNGFIGKVNQTADKALNNKKLMLGASALALGAGLVQNLNMFSNNTSNDKPDNSQQDDQNKQQYQNEYSDGDYSGGSGYNQDYSQQDLSDQLTTPIQNIGNEWFSPGTSTNNQYAKQLYNNAINQSINRQYFTYTKDNSILNNLSYYHGLYQ